MNVNLSIKTANLDSHKDLFQKIDIIIEETPGLISMSVFETHNRSTVTYYLNDGRGVLLQSEFIESSDIFKCDVYVLIPFCSVPNAVFNWHPFNEMGGLDIRKFRQGYIDYVIKTY